MAEINWEKANSVYKTAICAFESDDLKYDRDDGNLTIKSGFNGDDFNMEFILKVNAEKEVVQLFSVLPFKVPEDKRVDLAIAICAANYGLVNGSFDYDISDGSIIFRMTTSYKDSIIGIELIKYMIYVSIGTVDSYNDKFFMIGKNMMSVQDFMKNEDQN